MRQPMVAGNWKMNGSRERTHSLVSEIIASGVDACASDVVVCPPFVYLPDAAELLSGSTVALGAQDLDVNSEGAFTGGVSGPMLVDVGCRFVIVGHSERRTLYGEDDAAVAVKAGAALGAGLVPIVCVGETLEQREAGTTESVVGAQVDAVIEALGIDGCAGIVLAYEPVWAIGTGKTATVEQAGAVHAFIRERLANRDPEVASSVRILYGGSVKPDNAAALFAHADIDGGLIGGASLKAADFLAICQAAG